jgi:spore coat polysaccharide biosynthesis predicted glycosyltransferase SpsG
MGGRIAIVTAIGGLHGMGHATRCRALADELTSLGGEVLFFTQTPRLYDMLANYKCLVSEHPMSHARQHMPNIIVVDQVSKGFIPKGMCEGIRKSGIRVVRIDHLESKENSCDLCVVPNAHQTVVVSKSLAARFGERLLIGWDYVMLDSSVTSIRGASYKKRADGDIYFCAGGSDPSGALPFMIQATTVSSETQKLPKSFGLGRHRDYGMVRTVSKYLSYRIGPFDRRKLRESALVVGTFGQTAYECIYWGTPMLCLGHSSDNAAASIELVRASKGAVQTFSSQKISSMDEETFSHFVARGYADKDALMAMHKASKGLIDGKGVHRIATAIMALL